MTGPRKKRARRPGPGERRALSDQGGPVQLSGDPEVAGWLGLAMKAGGVQRGAGGPDDPDSVTHGFHSYPARMHAGVARTVLAHAASRGANVLDPFCGSGTVLVEAMVAGCHAAGVDLNPIALRIAEVKTALYTGRARSRLLRTARDVAARSEERVRDRVDARAKLHKSETHWYGGHTLKELAGLFEEISAVEDERDRRVLQMVFSSNLIKVSRQRSDTAERTEPKRIRKGLPTELFVRRAEELVDRLTDFAEAVPRGTAPARLFEGDARRLHHILPRRAKADLVLSSPPYGGTWDYADHHVRRYPWLGIDARRMKRFEVGARRNLGGHDAVARWDAELGDVLRAIESVLSRRGRVVLLMGDATLGRRRIHAVDQLAHLAPAAGLQVVATASQARADWLGGPARHEHLVLLVRGQGAT